MSGEEKRRRPAPSATPWDGAGDGELSPAERIVRDCHRDMYRYRHAGAGLVGEADFFNGYDRDACPRCGSPAIEGNGRDANGVRRWRCLSCGRAFNPATGTVFDGRKLPVADWTEFLLEVFSYGSLAGAARSGRRSATTPPYVNANIVSTDWANVPPRPRQPIPANRTNVLSPTAPTELCSPMALPHRDRSDYWRRGTSWAS